MTLTDTVRPRQVRAGAGERRRVITDLVTIKTAAEDTGGAYALFELATPPAGGCPPHAQRYEDEILYVLAGSYRVLLGEQTVELGTGDSAFVPRGTVHASANAGSEPARLLLFVTPGGVHEQFLLAVGDDPERPAWQPDMAKVLAMGPTYGVAFARPDGGEGAD